MDLDIKVEAKLFTNKLYYKRGAFNFNITNFPNLRGNIPKKTAYGVFISQLIRYSTACMEYIDFVTRSRSLVTKLMGQHYDRCELKRAYMKFTKTYKDHMSKYDVHDSVKDIFLAGYH